MMLRFICKLLGEDFEMLQSETPQSKKKVMLLGSVLFVPVIMWLIQGVLVGAVILQLTWFASLTIGLTSALLIFFIERSIIMTSSISRRLIAFRLLLGFIIAAIGSVIIDEVIFHEDISNNMAKYKSQSIENQTDSIRSKYTLKLGDLSQTSTRQFTNWNNSLKEVKAEADGTGGSGIKGVSAITKTKMILTEQQRKTYESTLQQLQILEQKRDQEVQQFISEFEASFSENSLLTRVKVLFDLVKSDTFVMIIYVLFTVFFFGIEFVVIVIKTTVAKTNYELKIQMIEEIGRFKMQKILERELSSFNPAIMGSQGRKAMATIDQCSPRMFKAS